MRAKALFTYLGLTLLALFLAAPFFWMLLVSLHPSRSPIPELSAILPQNWAWENYGIVLFRTEIPVGRFFFNSLFVSAVVVAAQVLV